MTELQEKAIAHYDRMIAWAKTRPEKGIKAFMQMRLTIGEEWGGGYCPYCNTYHISLGNCGACPLGDDDNCCGGLWWKLNAAETWGEWIVAAEAVKQYIIENGGE